jgi:hypothetical protein
MNMRDRTHGRGGRNGREGRGRGRVSFQDDSRNVSSTAIVEYIPGNEAGSQQPSDTSTLTSERGGRNGRGFGRGAYSREGGSRE